MKAKRIVVSLLTLLVLATALVGISSCGVNSGTSGDVGECAHIWKAATCTAPQTCEVCGVTEGMALGHDGSDGICGEQIVCQRCNADLGTSNAHVWVDATCTAAQYCSVCHVVEGTALGHIGGQADCEKAAVCNRCNEAYGEAKEHVWIEADCETAKHCANCTVTEGEALGHVWVDATCTKAQYCETCTTVVGKPKDHDWIDANCTTPSTCASCSATSGDPVHVWVDATCTEAKHCESCSVVDGDPLGHKGGVATCEALAICETCSVAYGELGDHVGGTATCASSAICEVCKDSYGDPLDHSWVAASCTVAKHCRSCDATEGEALGHSGGVATCSAQAICDNCHQGYGALSYHSYTAVVNTVYVADSGNCVTPATYYYSCEVCGDKDTERTFTPDGAAPGHSYGEWTVADAKHTRTCTVCHESDIGDCAYVVTLTRETNLGSAATCEKPAVCSTCAHEYGEALGHDWNEGTITTAPGCTTAGVKTYECNSCNGTKTEAVAPTGHSYGEYSVTTPATCTTAGERTAECICGDAKVESIPATGHTPGVAATCTAPQVCTVCTTELAPATGHSYVLDSSEPASCTAAQLDTYKCSCGDSYSESVGTPIDHNIVNVTPTLERVDAAKCEYVQHYRCNACGADVVGKTVTSHESWTAAITTPATCTTDGVKTLTCDHCKETKTEAIVADKSLGHALDGGVEGNGVIVYSCTRDNCDYTKTVKVLSSEDKVSGDDLDNELKVNDTNFNLDEGVKDVIGDKDVSISSDKLSDEDKGDLGLDEDQLAQIGNNPVYNFTITDANNNLISDFGEENYITVTLHYELSEGEDVDSIAIWFITDEGEVEAIKATYNNGYVTFQTDHFSRYTVTRLTPKQRCALYGHSSTFTTVEPTCTVDGYTLEYCIRCGYSGKTTSEEQKAFDHSYVAVTTPATCTTAGSTVYTCSTCDHSYTSVIGALNHNYVETNRVNATCQAPGSVTYTCDRDGCDASYNETLAQLDHVIADVVTAPTCIEGGYTTHSCSNEGCDYTYVDTYTAPIGHDYEAVYDWDGDKYERGKGGHKHDHVTVKLVCKNCGDEIDIKDDDIRLDHEETKPGCDHKGHRKSTVRFTYNGHVYEHFEIDDNYFTDFRHEHGNGFNKYDEYKHWNECKCGDREHEASHKFDNGTIIKVATCNTDGEIAYRCECGYIKIVAVPKTNHSYSKGWESDETNHWHTCSVCGETNAVAEHEFGRGKVNKEANCSTEGEIVYRCACGYVKTEIIPVNDNHRYNEKDIKHDENTHWYECRDCHGKCEEEAHNEHEIHVGKDATCTEAGEQAVKCSCGYEWTEVIDALGHSYGEEDLKSDENTHWYECTVCGEKINEAEHERTEITVTKESTCIEDGEQTVKCSCGYEKTEVIPADTEKHSYDMENVKNDENTHWYECTVCGEKVNEAEHDRAEVTITKESTCTEDGEQTVKCSCGYEWTETVSMAGGSHTYDETDFKYDENAHWNECSACGEKINVSEHKVAETVIIGGASCDDPGEKQEICSCGYVISTAVVPGGSHALTETVTIDLSEYGVCSDAVVTYMSCKCGATNNIDMDIIEDLMYYCNMDEGEYDEGVDENGRMWMSSSADCPDCGMHGYVYAYAEQNGCLMTIHYELTLTKDDQTIVDKLNFIISDYNHNTDSAVIDLSEYSACGGWIEVQRCVNCGEIRYLKDISIKCNIDEPTPEEIVIDGITYIKGSAACPDCDLSFEVVMWTIYESECEYTEYQRTIVKCGDEVIMDYTYEEHRGEHKYDYTYELLGTTCEDGVIVTGICSVCGETTEYRNYGHTRTEFVTIDLSKYSSCGGFIDGYKCSACGEITSTGKMNIHCNIEEPEIVETVIDGVTYYSGAATCPDCGLVFEATMWTIYENECEYTEYHRTLIKLGDEVIYSGIERYYNNNHNYNTEYILNGDSCSDGYTVIQTCTVCGHVNEWRGSGHMTKYHRYDLKELGMCGGWIEMEICDICDACTYAWDNYYCKWEISDVKVEGCEVYTCLNCGATRTVATTVGEMDEKCGILTTTETVLTINGENVLNYTSEYTSYNHSYDREIIMNGDSCTDGYIVINTCTVCGESYRYESQGHSVEYVYVDLSKYSSCGGYFSGYKCTICGEFDSVESLRPYCSVAEVAPEAREETIDGITYIIRTATCPDCGLVFETREWTVGESACVYTQYYQTKIQSGDEVLLNYISERHTEEHDLVKNVEYFGEGCDDGYTVTTTCANCDYYSQYEGKGHNYEYMHINISNCGSHVYGYKCNVCENWSKLEGDIGYCDQSGAVVDEYTENGVTYERISFTCSICQYEYQLITWVIDEGSCKEVTSERLIIRNGDEVIVDATVSYSSGEHNYETTYEFSGAGCESGYIVYEICVDCGDSKSYEGSGHMTEYQQILLSELGLGCGGWVEMHTCRICNDNTYAYYSSNCSWSYVGVNADGYDEYNCRWCGATRYNYNETSEKDENCTQKITNYTVFVVNGEEIFRFNNVHYNANHNYEETVTMNGESCEDGYTVYGECTDCGTSYERYDSYHNSKLVYSVPFAELGGCEHHYFNVHSCYCGEYTSFDWDSYNYSNSNGTYTCFNCTSVVTVDRDDVADGCNHDVTIVTSISVNGEALYSVTQYEAYVKHSFVFTAFIVDGVINLDVVCSGCDFGSDDEDEFEDITGNAELAYDEKTGEYNFDVVFVPEESGRYAIYSMATWDTYVTLYRVDGDNYNLITTDDSAGNGNNFRLVWDLEAGNTYVYRIRNYNRGESDPIPYVITMTNEDYGCAHNYTTYRVLAEGAESCSDGVVTIQICEKCGNIANYYAEYDHYTYQTDYIDLSQYGICSNWGYISFYSCACGESSGMNYGFNCPMYGEWSYATDDNGVSHEIYTQHCDSCGFTVVRDGYSVREGCKVSNCYTYTFTIGETVILSDYTYAWNTWYEHTYGTPTFTFDTEDQNCESGVTVHYQCTECDYTYDETRTYHSTILKERVDLAELGTCGGYIELHECPCGKEARVNYSTNCMLNGWSESYVGDDGRSHNKWTHSCETCGLTFVEDLYYAIENCQRVTYRSYVFTLGEEEIFSALNVATGRSTYHDYQYELVYDTEDQNCESGVTVKVTCSGCDYANEYHRTYHSSSDINKYYYLSDFGVCGVDSYIRVRSCACGYSSRFNQYIYSCSFSSNYDYYTDDNGVEHTVHTQNCSDCGLTIARDEYVLSDGCKRVRYYDYSVSVGDEVVISEFKYVYNRWEDHKYGVPTFAFDTEDVNCESGVTVHYECSECGYSYDEHRTYHSTILMERIDLAELGSCGGYVELYECPCGAEKSVSTSTNCYWSGKTELYVDESGVSHLVDTYTCSTCSFVRILDKHVEKNGCERLTYTDYTYTISDEEIFSCDNVITSRTTNHDYQYSWTFDNEGDSCDDGVNISITCADCDYTNSYYRSYHDNYVVTNRYYLSDFGACGIDSYIELRQCPCGYSTYFYNGVYNCNMSVNNDSYTDENGVSHDVNTRECSDCGLIIVRDGYTVSEGCNRIGYYTYSVSVGDAVVVSEFDHINSRRVQHTYGDPIFTFLTEDQDCESGVTCTYECTLCDYREDNTYYYHNTILRESYDLTEYGACYGYVNYYECACGESNYISHNICAYSGTSNSYYDEDGIYHHVNAYSCSSCGLRYQDDYTSIRDSATCTRNEAHTIAISVGATFVAEIKYDNHHEEHDYLTTGRLADGATDCEGGVIVTFTCRDCNYTYDDTWSTHMTFESQRFNIQDAAYGSAICPGYFVLNSCVCGEYKHMGYDTLCHFGHYGVESWIEDAATGWIRNAENYGYWNHLSNSATRMTCSVTDPEQCGYTVRYADYWLFDDVECKVYNYQTWQFGYNEATDTYAYEITFKTGSSYTHHPYEITDLGETWDNGYTKVSGTRYDCPRCESYYYEKNTYSENGEHLSYDLLFENKLEDGTRKLYQDYREYTNGNTSLQLYRYIDANGVETWNKYEYTRNNDYVGPFGESGYEYEEKHSDQSCAEGEYTYVRNYAYVHYKGYRYDIFSYTTHNNGSWERYDYTYNFDGTCERTTHYATNNGDGVDETYTDTCHRTYQTFDKNPTCTQDGYYDWICYVCENVVENDVKHNPYDHSWYMLEENYYVCTRCGIENINGASGDIVLEDLTSLYGNEENYVAGYWARNDVQFLYYVSLILHVPMEDGNDEIILPDIVISELDNVRAVAFSKSAVTAAAEALGYTEDDYYVRFAFVPLGADGSYDYAITFTEDEAIEVVDTQSLQLTVLGFLYEDIIIKPTVSGYWTLTSYDATFDVHGDLYDANGNMIDTNDDGNGYPNFRISHYFEAGQTYILRVRYHSMGNSGVGTVTVEITAPTVE